MKRLNGKVALITGGAKGLGLAIARLFAQHGAAVALADLQEEIACEAARELVALNYRAVGIACDVRLPEQWTSAWTNVEAAFGPVDLLVNNAGVAELASIEEMDLDGWRATMAVNLDGVFLGTKCAIEHMRSRGGSIINMSSIRAVAADPNSIAYDASKAGVAAITRSAAVHCARNRYGIRINTLHPGYVLTDMVNDAIRDVPDPNALLRQLEQLHPIGRLGTAEEIAKAALFLASEDSAFVLGSSLFVDGGFTAV